MSNNRSLIRGSPNAMTFSNVKYNESNIILRHVLNNTKPTDLHQYLFKALNNNVFLPSDLDRILVVLRNCGIVTLPSQSAARDNARRHCVRCHKNYFERDNGFMACIIPHKVEAVTSTDGEGGSGPSFFYWSCCAQLPPSGHGAHSVDRHTTISSNVQYNGCNVKPCVPSECFPSGEETRENK
jgi:hypothetical protein